MIPDDPDDRAALAGEYVLGTLAPEDAAEVARALRDNDALRREVALWEERLHPLAMLAGAAEPPASTWRRIAAALPAPPRPAWRRVWGSAPVWRGATLAAGAIAAALALYVGRPTPAPLVAVLHPATGTAASFVATVAGQRLTLLPVAAAAPPPGRTFELWVIGRGEKTPLPLGVLPPDARLARAALPPQVAGGALLAISVEPPGGSPTGLPTGPVVFVGNVQTES